ncbi:MAG: ABC transporter permease subunit [Archangiaceae bacterium]|nr:ABC transporter permease subunit [Archangiaceae bacterium]
MNFSWARARAIFWKDFLDLRKNRALLASMSALPLMLVVVPAGVVWAYARRPDDPNLEVIARYYEATVRGPDAVRFLIDKVLVDWFSVYLIMPVFVPILVSSFAIAGEKERRTLEPLLASPVTGLELLIGKSLASLVPAIAICILAFGLLCLTVDFAAGAAVLPTPMWTFGVFVIAPLFAFFGNGVAVVISGRVGDSRLAQQLAGMTVLPLVGLAAGQFGGFLKAGFTYYLLITAFVLVLDVGLLLAATRLFDRERLMTRWG